MIKPLFLGVAVFLFVIEGAKKGQTICKFYPGHQQLLNKSHIIIRLRNPYLPVFESDKRLIETDKLIWFPAKNPSKNSLAGFLF